MNAVNNLNSYAQALGAREDVFWWVNNTGKKALSKGKADEKEIEHIIDFFASSAAPKRLQKMSFEDAQRKSKEWTERNQKKGRDLEDGPQDIETVMQFDDGGRIVRLLSDKAFKREGSLMSHCLGGYNSSNEKSQIFSYRDTKNRPHVTIELSVDTDRIIQIKGKGNGSVHPRYVNFVIDFLCQSGHKVQGSDMINLGYYPITAQQIKLVEALGFSRDELVVVNGDCYAN